MGVMNGERFLEEQIRTIDRQQNIDRIDLWISDDGSTDGSRKIIDTWARSWSKGAFRILAGPRKGFAENYRSMMINPDIDGDFFAFSDQDDIWDGNKLDHALKWLETQPTELPALYCTRTRSVDSDGNYFGMSPDFRKPPHFRNALVQSIAGANTMVMNRAAWHLMHEASMRTTFVSHDWWCYLIVTGAGGTVRYSSTPDIGYRQHGANLVGANNSWQARMARLGRLMEGTFVEWNELNLRGLAACDDLLTTEARQVVAEFRCARSATLPVRLLTLLRSGLYRQTHIGQAGLYAACLLRRI